MGSSFSTTSSRSIAGTGKGMGSCLSTTSSHRPGPTPADQQTKGDHELREFLGGQQQRQRQRRPASARVVSEEETETAGSIAVPAYDTSGADLDTSEGPTCTWMVSQSQEVGRQAHQHQHQAARTGRSLNMDAVASGTGLGDDGEDGFGDGLVVAPGKMASVPKRMREMEGLVLETGDGGITSEDWLDVTHAMLGSIDDLGPVRGSLDSTRLDLIN